MTWCRLLPVANDVTNPAAVLTNLGQVGLNGLSGTVDGTVQNYLLTTGRQLLRASLGGGLPQPLDLSGLPTGTCQALVTGTSATGAPLRQVLRLTKE